MRFEDPQGHSHLDAMSGEALDELTFGVIRLDGALVVTAYNRFERQTSGLRQDHVLGHAFFVEVGPCMNNYLVAQRLADEPELDVTIPYVLTFRMRPTPVRLRLLRSAASPHRYVLLERQS